MKCPFCGFADTKVIDSRLGKEGNNIRRRRECFDCERRFTTYERIEETLPLVIKKDGRREPYDRGKLLAGLHKACEKRPVATDTIESLADYVERKVEEAETREVSSSVIGEAVMSRLKDLDDVAYVRFASVYKSFRDIDEFMAALESLVKERGHSGNT